MEGFHILNCSTNVPGVTLPFWRQAGAIVHSEWTARPECQGPPFTRPTIASSGEYISLIPCYILIYLHHNTIQLF